MKRILVVDDSILIQNIIHDVLETHFPCVIKVVADGAQAYEELANNSYDLVITDIVMPIMDGLTLAEKIRVELGSDVPIIMLTSLGVKNVRDSASTTGVNAYLIKPINISQLVQVVSRFIPAEIPAGQKEISSPVHNGTFQPVQDGASPPVQNETSPTELDETSLPEIEEWSAKIDEDW